MGDGPDSVPRRGRFRQPIAGDPGSAERPEALFHAVSTLPAASPMPSRLGRGTPRGATGDAESLTIQMTSVGGNVAHLRIDARR